MIFKAGEAREIIADSLSDDCMEEQQVFDMFEKLTVNELMYIENLLLIAGCL